jgi:replicative DNA helicase
MWIYGAEQQRRFLTDVGIHGARGSRLASAIAALEGLASNPDVDELSHPVLEQLASDDLTWDEIVEIEPLGEQEVFDATVDQHHNFVAEGLVLHNSIEQDADIVGFIYRDEVYDEDSPDKGIAELIVAKHRNGATGVVKLAFLNHLTTFANLARNAPGAPGPNGGGGPPTPV